MHSKKHKTKDTKSKNIWQDKKKLGIIGGIAGAVLIIVCILIAVLCVGRKDYKIVDLTDKSVAEACSAARSHGWIVDEPIRKADDSGSRTDCDNAYAVVDSYSYDKENHIVTMRWDYYQLTLDDIDNKTVSEICEFGKQHQLTFKPFLPYTSSQFDAVTSCNDDRMPDEVFQEDGEFYMGFAKEPTSTGNSSTAWPSGSSSPTITEPSHSGSTASGSSSSTTTLGKCKTGDRYPISENGHYVVGVDIPAGTYAPESGSISFDIFKTQSKYDADDGNFIWLINETKTVQLNDGNIIDDPISTGYIVCQ